MTGLALTLGGWAAFALALAVAARVWHAALLRGEAVARACHELRGPLAAVRLGLESPGAVGSSGRLRAIELELDRAAVALDDLQGVYRGAGGSPASGGLGDLQGLHRDELSTPGLVHVRPWLARSVEAWRPVAAACGMEIRLDWTGADAVVWGDESRLAQVTGNLIANAIDHGDGYVEVRGRADQGTVVIDVLDGGPGLQAMPRALIVDRRPRRYRVGGAKWRKRNIGPRGHGLAIARAVTQAHGGSLMTAPSEHGARLVVTLPLAEELAEL